MGSHVGLINAKILVLHTVKVYGVDLASIRGNREMVDNEIAFQSGCTVFVWLTG